MSLDGFVAGPNQSLQEPLGVGGEQLHEWVFPLEAWRRPHGMDGGVVNESTPVMEEELANIGATIMGRNMFGGGPGPWSETYCFDTAASSMTLPGSDVDGVVSCSMTRTRRTTSSSISSRRIRTRPRNSRPMDKAPMANAPTATAPMAMEPRATAPMACAPVAAAGVVRERVDSEGFSFMATLAGHGPPCKCAPFYAERPSTQTRRAELHSSRMALRPW